MPNPRSTAQTAGAEAVLHPAFVRDYIAPLLRRENPATRATDQERFDQLRSRAGAAAATTGVAHPGRKGRAVQRAKRAIQRGLYWYVDPAFDAMRSTCLSLIDETEALTTEIAQLREELDALRRDHELEADARRRELERSAPIGR